MDIINKMMLRKPNSNPPNGRNANNPPKPRTLAILMAQEGQEGAMIAITTPEAPMETLEEICLRKRKMLNEMTTPVSKDIVIKEIKDHLE